MLLRDPLGGIETLLVRQGDHIVGIGGRSAYLEDIEAFEAEVRAQNDKQTT